MSGLVTLPTFVSQSGVFALKFIQNKVFHHRTLKGLTGSRIMALIHNSQILITADLDNFPGIRINKQLGST